jgi:hypothetical protein
MNISKFKTKFSDEWDDIVNDMLNSRNLDKCKDCKWMRSECGIGYCEHPRVRNSVYYAYNGHKALCSRVREEYMIGNQRGCGPKAKLFEPKPQEKPQPVPNYQPFYIMNRDQIDYDKCLSCKWFFIENGKIFGEYRYCTNPVVLSSILSRSGPRQITAKMARLYVHYCGPDARHYEDITTDMGSYEYIEFLESQPLEVIEQYGLRDIPKLSFWSSIKQLISRIFQRKR